MSSTTSASTGDNVIQNTTIKAVVPIHNDDTDGPLKSIAIADHCSCELYSIYIIQILCVHIIMVKYSITSTN